MISQKDSNNHLNQMLPIIASALSQAEQALFLLVNRPVQFKDLQIYEAPDSPDKIEKSFSPDQIMVIVQQTLAGDIHGRICLLCPLADAKTQISLLAPKHLPTSAHTLTLSEKDVIQEVANIVFNSLAGSLMNRLQGRSQVSVPEVRVNTWTDITSDWAEIGSSKAPVIAEALLTIENLSAASQIFIILLDDIISTLSDTVKDKKP